MGDLIEISSRKFQLNKICNQPKGEPDPPKVYTCKCGCQVFQIYDFGTMTCIGCTADYKLAEIF